MLTIILFAYTEFLSDPEVKYDLGWVSIILFLLLIVLNFGRIILNFINAIKLYIMKGYYLVNKHSVNLSFKNKKYSKDQYD